MESISWYKKGMEWRYKLFHDVKSAKWCQKECEIRHDVMSLRQKVNHGVNRYVVIAKGNY